MFCKAKSAKKLTFFLRGDFRPLPNKNVQMWDHFFPLLFPKDSKSLKILDNRLQEVGAKRRLNGTSKVNTQTNTHMDMFTYRKHRPRGPMLWKFVKIVWNIINILHTSSLKDEENVWLCLIYSIYSKDNLINLKFDQKIIRLAIYISFNRKSFRKNIFIYT